MDMAVVIMLVIPGLMIMMMMMFSNWSQGEWWHAEQFTAQRNCRQQMYNKINTKCGKLAPGSSNETERKQSRKRKQLWEFRGLERLWTHSEPSKQWREIC